jgi:hypothetical protein
MEYLNSAMPGKLRYREKNKLVKISRIISIGKP